MTDYRSRRRMLMRMSQHVATSSGPPPVPVVGSYFGAGYFGPTFFGKRYFG